MGSVRAGWQEKVFVHVQSASASWSSAPASLFYNASHFGVRDAIYMLPVNNGIDIKMGLEQINQRKIQGRSYRTTGVYAHEFLHGVYNPSTSLDFDVTATNLIWALWTLCQDGSSEGSASPYIKTFANYTTSTCEAWVCVGQYKEDSDNPALLGGIAQSINLTVSKDQPLRATVEVLGAVFDDDTMAGSTASTLLDDSVPLLCKDLTVQYDTAAGNTPATTSTNGFNLTLSNNAERTFYNSGTCSGYVLNDFDVTGSVFIPWSAAEGGTNTILDDLKAAAGFPTDNVMHMWWGHAPGTPPVAGELQIVLNTINQEPTWTNNVEMGWEVPFTNANDGTNSFSLLLVDADDTDWAI